MTNEDKKAATIKRAEENKANFDLHQKLIKQHIEFDIGNLKQASVEYFLENGRPTGGFLLALMAYAEDYHKTKVKEISTNVTVMRSACEFCGSSEMIIKCSKCDHIYKTTND